MISLQGTFIGNPSFRILVLMSLAMILLIQFVYQWVFSHTPANYAFSTLSTFYGRTHKKIEGFANHGGIFFIISFCGHSRNFITRQIFIIKAENLFKDQGWVTTVFLWNNILTILIKLIVVNKRLNT